MSEIEIFGKKIVLELECPACHRVQMEVGPECQFCGVIFAKWSAKKRRQAGEPDSEITIISSQPEIVTVPPDHHFSNVYKPIRTLFGLLLFFVEPWVQFIHNLISHFIPFSPLTLIAMLCFLAGILSAAIASRDGYSDVRTAAGAGLLGGGTRFLAFCITASEFDFEKLTAVATIFCIYSFCASLGGIAIWTLKNVLGIQLV